MKRKELLRNIALKRKQFDSAMSGNVQSLIWLGKQYLNQREPKEDVFEKPELPPEFESMSIKELTEYINENYES